MNTQEVVRSQVYYQITWDFFCSISYAANKSSAILAAFSKTRAVCDR